MSRRMSRRMWPVGLVVLALALVGIGVDRALAWHRADTRVAAGHAAVAAAEREVTAIFVGGLRPPT